MVGRPSINVEWETGLAQYSLNGPGFENYWKVLKENNATGKLGIANMYGARFFGDILGYNPLVEPNKHGNSGGFFSAGHRNRDIIWNWPSVDDRVHIVGNWVWDRGHSENGALTEIHPARLISIQRNLPSLIYDNGAPVPSLVCQSKKIQKMAS